MHDHRQVALTGKFKLGDEVVLLLIVIESLDEIIESTFSNRDGSLTLDDFGQVEQMLGHVLIEKHRMQAIRRVQARLRMTDLAQMLPA